ncbi:MAG: hypothetical protein GEU88_20775, partial [Solirubrobacterales bacterium]|nr:hypothetical protein [Solirubrobacterales bacterium]
GHPTQWFVRSQMYACVCPAPFFDTEVGVAPGEALTFRYAVVIADGEVDVDRATQLAELGSAALADSLPGAASVPESATVPAATPSASAPSSAILEARAATWSASTIPSRSGSIPVSWPVDGRQARVCAAPSRSWARPSRR